MKDGILTVCTLTTIVAPFLLIWLYWGDGIVIGFSIKPDIPPTYIRFIVLLKTCVISMSGAVTQISCYSINHHRYLSHQRL
jgi:hypothetical protein